MRIVSRSLAILFFAAAVASTALANDLAITLEPPDGDATIVLQPALTAAGAAPTVIRVAAKGAAPIHVDIAPGQWMLHVESTRGWHAPQFVSVAGATTEAVAWLLPSGSVTGTVTSKEQRKLPAEMIVRFSSEKLNGESVCPVADGRFRCQLPAGTFDLRMRPADALTRFFWTKTIEVGKATDVGEVTLQRGASIIGRVIPARGVTADLKKIVVTARPSAVDTDDPVVRAIGLMTLTATLEPKGLFHIDGVAPGDYTLRAAVGRRLMSQSVIVLVHPGVTSELKDPLVIDRPKTLRVTITPPLDPANKPWRVDVGRQIGINRDEGVAASNASATGEWTSPPLIGGKYSVSVSPSTGGTWFNELFTVDRTDLVIPLTLASRPLRGHITLGGKPLAAKLTLTPEGNRMLDAEAMSDEGGDFATVLPANAADKRWTVVIESNAPVVRRTLRGVTTKPRDDSNAVEMSLELPLNALAGTVVDKEGKPVPLAIVNATLPGDEHHEFWQSKTEVDGSFQVAGLAAGKYEVSVQDYMRESRPVTATVVDDAPPELLRIVLDDDVEVHGRIFSEFGPVGGAIAFLTPTDIAVGAVGQAESDATGEFASIVPAAAREVNVFVAPPGFVLKLFHTHLQPGKMMNIPVDQRGGTLIVPGASGTLLPQLAHAGATSSALLIPEPWRTTPVEAERVVLESLEPGSWTLCMIAPNEYAAFDAGFRPDDRCASGFLPPFGTLTLEPKKK